jgi:hypothetical protein
MNSNPGGDGDPLDMDPLQALTCGELLARAEAHVRGLYPQRSWLFARRSWFADHPELMDKPGMRFTHAEWLTHYKASGDWEDGAGAALRRLGTVLGHRLLGGGFPDVSGTRREDLAAAVGNAVVKAHCGNQIYSWITKMYEWGPGQWDEFCGRGLFSHEEYQDLRTRYGRVQKTFSGISFLRRTKPGL